jgi:hypothetical protein
MTVCTRHDWAHADEQCPYCRECGGTPQVPSPTPETEHAGSQTLAPS